jgi:hypothetical protein
MCMCMCMCMCMDVSNENWKTLYGLHINTYYQVMSAVRAKAVVQNIHRAIDWIRPTRNADHAAAQRYSRAQCTLAGAARMIDSNFD